MVKMRPTGATGRQILNRAMSEAAFQDQVIDLLEIHKYIVYHTYDSRRSQSGFPDIVGVRAPRLLFVELKIDRTASKLSSAQEWWLQQLGRVASANKTIEVYEWRPSQWDEIVEIVK